MGLSREEKENMLRETSYLETTRNIKVQVTPRYLEEKSIPLQDDFIFQYDVKITNSEDSDIQILGSELVINNAQQEQFNVINEDVNDEQACIPYRDTYEYTEFFPINSATGNLRGFYWIKNIQTQEVFKIKIPLVFFKTIDTPVEVVDIQKPLYAASM